MTRYAKVHATAEMVKPYLPGNYHIMNNQPTNVSDDVTYIAGTDNAGWTLDEYVIPRLASGMIFAEEVKAGIR